MSQTFSAQVEILDENSKVAILLGKTQFGFGTIMGSKASRKHGNLVLQDRHGVETIYLHAEEPEVRIGGKNQAGVLHITGRIYIADGKSGGALLRLGPFNNAGSLILCDEHKKDVIKLEAKDKLIKRATLTLGTEGHEGYIRIKNDEGREVISLCGDEGELKIKNREGKTTIHLYGNSGDIRLAGADCAEEFDVEGSEEINPGTVMIIDENSKLVQSKEPYDKRVAGVVSGGNGINPGIILHKKSAQNKRLPISLNGKVFCKVDATYFPVGVGDLLTTSSTPGYAMKAEDTLKAFGTVIGKSLCSLKSGKGLVPILVALQ